MKTLCTINEFANNLKEALASRLPEHEVTVYPVLQNNGISKFGLQAKKEDQDCVPTFYLEMSYNNYLKGKPFNIIVESFVSTILEGSEVPEYAKNIGDNLVTWDYVKERIIMNLINAESNAELLRDIPHTIKEDLAITYRVLYESTSEGMVSSLVTNTLMSEWNNVTLEDIHAAATENTRKLLPAKVQSMQEVLYEMCAPMLAVTEMESIPDEEMMYVISNETKTNGAVTIFYDGVLKNIAEKIGSDLYIIPSSVHECLAVSRNTIPAENLTAMIQDVNISQVELEEQLSDHAYIYLKDEDKIIAA